MQRICDVIFLFSILDITDRLYYIISTISLDQSREAKGTLDGALNFAASASLTFNINFCLPKFLNLSLR